MTSRKNVEIVRTTSWSAGPGCHGGCGVLAHVRDGKLVKIEEILITLEIKVAPVQEP